MNALPLLKTINTLAGALTPSIPAQLARNLLLRPRRHRPRAWEVEAARSAQRVTFRFGLSGLRWGTEGPVVLMMHGWEGRPTQFGHLVEPLLASGRQIIALDGPAHGESPGSEATLMEFAMALLEAAVEIPQLETMIGHSMGGAAAAIALSQGLPAERAVLIAAPSNIEDGLYGFAGALGLAPRAASRFVRLIGDANGVPAHELQISALARRLRIPALIVHDRDDAAVPFADGEAIAQAWPRASLLATTGLGHQRVLTDARVAAEIAAFVTPARTHLSAAA